MQRPMSARPCQAMEAGHGPRTQGSAPAGTYVETATVGAREDLADIIYRIDPDETPLVSACARVGAKQVLTEWLLQELNAAAAIHNPRVLLPSCRRCSSRCDSTMPARSSPARSACPTPCAWSTSGGEDEYNRQLILRGMEVKRDLELAVTSPLVRTITDPRHMSGLPCYTVNGVRGAGAGVMPVGDG